VNTAHQPYRTINADGPAPFVIIADHASNLVPPELGDLGLPPSELARHIAWDIGSAGVAELLAGRFDAPAIICGTSRLVIDCNRHLTDTASIPQVSDGTSIPGNRDLTAVDRAMRAQHYFIPYHDAVEQAVARKCDGGHKPVVLSIHSMTPAMGGIARPWQIAISSFEDRSLADPVLEALRNTPDITVGDNQPYALDPAEDYSVPVHAMRRGLAHIQVEFRQDMVATTPGIAAWARIFGDALTTALDEKTRPRPA
jgi:predicted N-formylglutamate amidohydrolase